MQSFYAQGGPLRVDEWQSPDRLDLRDWRIQAGPVATAYEMTQARCAQIIGPTGGGKSTVSARRPLRVATWQYPSPRDGIRKARICVVCPTYRRAWDQVMPSYFKVMPQTLGTFRGSRGDPADHIYDMPVMIDGKVSQVHVEVLFRAVNDMDLEEFVRGFEVTAWWWPECDTNDSENLISKCLNRAGRYPEPEDRPENIADISLIEQTRQGWRWKDTTTLEQRVGLLLPAYSGGFGDANAPKIGSWYHKRFYLQPKAGDLVFRQPAGDSANAENMAQLRKISPDYYGQQKADLDEHDYRRLIQCKPGYGREGQPVQPDFDELTHVASQTLAVDRFNPVIIGVDAGSNALKVAATFSQRSYSGQWRTLAEIHLDEGQQMSTPELGEKIRSVYETRCKGAPGALIAIDPAAMSANASSSFTTAQELAAVTGIEVQPAPTNRPKDRRAALKKKLKLMVAPREPAFIVDPSCIGLITGLTGGFHYPIRQGGASESPAKNIYSHVCEAQEYAILTWEGVEALSGGFIRPDGSGGYDAPTVNHGD